MVARVRRSGGWLTLAGVVALLLGLSWDAVLHRLDPALAEREGIFTLSNPGHLLFAGGITLIVAGVSLTLLGRAQAASGRSRLMVAGGASALLTLAAASFGVATWSGSGLTGGHTHTETLHVHEDGAVHIHDEHQAFVAQQGRSTAATGATTAATHDLPAEAATGSQVKSGIVHEHGETVAVTAEQVAAASKLVADVRAAAARFESFDTAYAEGFRAITTGQVIAHYHNQAYHTDGRILDPEHPEELIYATLPSGERKLVGFMFLMPDGDQPGPQIGGPLTVWHAHDNLCFNAVGVITALKGADGQCPRGTRFGGKTPEMLHVWLVDNPSGVFGEDMTPQTILKALGINQ